MDTMLMVELKNYGTMKIIYSLWYHEHCYVEWKYMGVPQIIQGSKPWLGIETYSGLWIPHV